MFWCDDMLTLCGSGSSNGSSNGSGSGSGSGRSSGSGSGSSDNNQGLQTTPPPLPVAIVASVMGILVDYLMFDNKSHAVFHYDSIIPAAPLLSALFQCNQHERINSDCERIESDRDARDALLVEFALSRLFDRVFGALHKVLQDFQQRAMLFLLIRVASFDPAVVERIFTESRLNNLAGLNVLPKESATLYAIIITRLLQGPRAVAQRVFAAASRSPGSVRYVLVNSAVSDLDASDWLVDKEYDTAAAERARERLPAYQKLVEVIVDTWTEAAIIMPLDNADNLVPWTPDLSRIESFIASGLLSAVLDSPDSSSASVSSSSSSRSSSTTIMTARLLRVLRKLIASTETVALWEQRVRGEKVPTNRFVEFYSSDSLRCNIFDLLLMADCTLCDGDNNPVMRELLPMLSAPECCKLFSNSERELRGAGNSDWRRAVEDVARFAQGFKGGWREAFDAYIAVELENHGFPRRRVVTNLLRLTTMTLLDTPAPVVSHGPPTPSALSLLQRRVRLLMRANSFSYVWQRELSVRFDVHNAAQVRQSKFDLIVSPDRAYGDDDELNCHIAFFMLGSKVWQGAFAQLHSCCLPPGLSAADAPFVTLFYGDFGLPCFPHHVTLPETDTVFGEYTLPSDIDTLTYPAGTVLLRSRSLLPSSIPSLLFVVFKPCPATLLRGAVPIGRVVGCGSNDVALSQADLQIKDRPPFTEERVSWLESFCAARRCSKRSRANCGAQGTLVF